MGQTFGYRDGDLPVTEELSGRLLRLPLFYDITEEEQSRVVEQVRAFLEGAVSADQGRVTAGPQRMTAEQDFAPGTLERLAWDSDLFGFPVARLTVPDLSEPSLRKAFQLARELGIRLVYWPSASRPELRQSRSSESSPACWPIARRRSRRNRSLSPHADEDGGAGSRHRVAPAAALGAPSGAGRCGRTLLAVPGRPANSRRGLRRALPDLDDPQCVRRASRRRLGGCAPGAMRTRSAW